MSRPKIALYADEYTGEGGGRVGQNVPYVEFFSLFGEVILVTSQNDFAFFIEHCDILALPGGADVDPRRYTKRPHVQVSRLNAHYETMDIDFLTPWVKTGKPIIGICRGLQSLNVVMGGTLFPHVDGHNNWPERRDKTPDKMYHWKDDAGTIPAVTDINSFHHQAINKLADGFKVIGWGPMYKNDQATKYNDNFMPMWSWDKFDKRWDVNKEPKSKDPKQYHIVIEAIEHTTLPYVAFQYHPEELNCDFAIEKIIKTLRKHESSITKGNSWYSKGAGKETAEKKDRTDIHIHKTETN